MANPFSQHGHLTEFARSDKAPGSDVGQHLQLCEATWTLEKRYSPQSVGACEIRGYFSKPDLSG
eukprot:scaffold656286_cov47-Prasinocladus_malaysianus.AAC.1